MSTQIEIERKYIIKMPTLSQIESMPEYTSSEITQIYLTSPKRVTHRIRSRTYSDKTVYTETTKVRIDEISATETEKQISAERFDELSENIADGSHVLRKVRHTFRYESHTVEIDIYPEWQNTAVLEVELSSRDESVTLPDFIKLINEVTGDKRYSNASMSHSFPAELGIDN